MPGAGIENAAGFIGELRVALAAGRQRQDVLRDQRFERARVVHEEPERVVRTDRAGELSREGFGRVVLTWNPNTEPDLAGYRNAARPGRDALLVAPGDPVALAAALRSVLTDADLRDAGLVRASRDGVRLLGSGELKSKANFEVYGASKSAVAAVEKAGGSVKILAPKQDEGEKAA